MIHTHISKFFNRKQITKEHLVKIKTQTKSTTAINDNVKINNDDTAGNDLNVKINNDDSADNDNIVVNGKNKR